MRDAYAQEVIRLLKAIIWNVVIILIVLCCLLGVSVVKLGAQDSTSIHVRWTDLGVATYEWFGKHSLNGAPYDSIFKDSIRTPETIWRVPDPPNPGDSIAYETCARAQGLFEDADGNVVSAPWGCLQWDSNRLPPVPPPPTLTVDTAQVVDVASGEVVGRVWAGAPADIVGYVELLCDGKMCAYHEWDDGIMRPHNPWLEPGWMASLCAYAYVTKRWDDGNEHPWAWNYGLADGEEITWGTDGAVVIEDWRTHNGWASNPDAPSGMKTCVQVWRNG